MSIDFSAREQTLGYLYQVRYSLWLLLNRDEDKAVLVESLDDIVFETQGNPDELLQLKHKSKPASLTDGSRDLWKTIRVWSTHLAEGKILPNVTNLTLITTASAADNSIAAKLRPNEDRDCETAFYKLIEFANESTSEGLKPCFDAFLHLKSEDQKAMINSIYILDKSANIHDTEDLIKGKIKLSVNREYLDGLYERLEGWWLRKIVEQLKSKIQIPVTGYELHDKIRNIADTFKPDALPIDFLGKKPEEVNPETDERMFVQQLRCISVNNKRIEKAIIDFYRAFEQRSRWVREDLLIDNEIELYEERLIDEWERYRLTLLDELDVNDSQDSVLQVMGRTIYNRLDQYVEFNIRPNVTESYVMRGSYHILANFNPPKVWWHPKFSDILYKLLKEGVIEE